MYEDDESTEATTPEQESEGINVIDPVLATKCQEFWLKEMTAAEKEHKKFRERGKKVVRKYLDEREGGNADIVDQDGKNSLNLFWSNTQVIMSNLYSKPPKVDVGRIFKDQNDDVARVAATILDRILNSGLEQDNSDFHTAALNGVEDYLLPGMGQIWLRYEAETEQIQQPPQMDPMTGEPIQLPPQEKVTWEDALSEYVYWEDFEWAPCRTWEDCRWVGRLSFLSRDAAAKRFGSGVAKLLPTTKKGGDRKNNNTLGPQHEVHSRIMVWEIWCKTDRKVYWYCPGYDKILDIREDPLELEGFFPCPRPLMANTTTSNFIARADYVMAQDQYNQIDELTTRIAWLTKACKVVGAYDKNSTALGRIFTEGIENQLIPVDNWAAFAEKGGIKGTIDFVPIDVVASVIRELIDKRAVLKADLYEVMGIGDIMRGVSSPSETLGAQQIKAQFGSQRLQFKQSAVACWAADAQRIKADIICKHFQPQTILERSNIMFSTDAQLAPQAVQLLKQNGIPKYRIQIEPDSMASLDWAAEREARSQAVEGMGVFMQSVTTLLQASPEATPVVLEILKWFMGGLKQARQIESVIDQAIAAATAPKQPTPPSPKEQAETDKVAADAMQKRSSGINDLADAASKGALAPVNAALMALGLPPINPQDVAASKAMDNPPPAPGEGPPNDSPPVQ